MSRWGTLLPRSLPPPLPPPPPPPPGGPLRLMGGGGGLTGRRLGFLGVVVVVVWLVRGWGRGVGEER